MRPSRPAARAVVLGVVVLAPAAQDAVAGAADDVVGGLVGRDPAGEARAGQPDARPQLEDVDAPEPLAEQLDGAASSGASRPRRAAAASSCRPRWVPAPPSARRARRSSRGRRAGRCRCAARPRRSCGSRCPDRARARSLAGSPRRIVAPVSTSVADHPVGSHSASGDGPPPIGHDPLRCPPPRSTPAARPHLDGGVLRACVPAGAQRRGGGALPPRSGRRAAGRAGPVGRRVVARHRRRRRAGRRPTACGCTARGSRAAGCARTPRSSSSTPGRGASRARSPRWRPRAPSSAPTRSPPAPTTTTRRARCRTGSSPRPLAPAPGARPGVPWADTVIYETHVRDLTMRHPAVPEHLRGTYAGLAHPAVIDHLVGLGRDDARAAAGVRPRRTSRRLLSRGPQQPLGLLDARLPRPAAALRLDARPRGRGVPGDGRDAARRGARGRARRRVQPHLRGRRRRARRCRGAASTPPAGTPWTPGAATSTSPAAATPSTPASPLVRTLVVDSLRHWVTTMGVDGFRFDLASTLGRPRGGAFDPAAPLLTDITTDPVLSTVKLIAEPWDATGEGYQVGGFGPAWAEWNGRFRDGVRDFWRGHGPLSEIVTRIAGSSDLYWPARTPAASVNFVTAHDGFTLADLVSYEHKHNEANGEQGRDGTDDNRSRQPRRRGADVRPGGPGPAGPAGAQPAHDAAALGGHADAPGWRRARPHPARQQQRLLAGRRDLLARRGTRPSSSTSSPARCPCAAPPRRCGAPTSSTAARTPTPTTPPRTSPGCTPTAASSPSPTSTHHGRTLVVRVDGGTVAAARAARRRRPPSTSCSPPPSATPPGPRCSTPARPAAPRRPTDPLPAGELLAVPAHTALVLRAAPA